MTDATGYRTLAARQAVDLYGKSYADYIERHTLELIAAGHLPESAVNQNLGERLAGNDGE